MCRRACMSVELMWNDCAMRLVRVRRCSARVVKLCSWASLHPVEYPHIVLCVMCVRDVVLVRFAIACCSLALAVCYVCIRQWCWCA